MHEDLDITNNSMQAGALPARDRAALRLRRHLRGEVEPHRPPRPYHHRMVRCRSSSCARRIATAISCRAVTIAPQAAAPKAVYANGRLSFEVIARSGRGVALLPALRADGRRAALSGAARVRRTTATSCTTPRRSPTGCETVLKIRTSNEEFYRLYRQALEDMAALRLPIAGTDHMVFVPAAGVPWFVAPFGRDSLIVSLQNMLVYPEFARGALDVLGSLQAKERRRLSRRRARQDPARDALRRAGAFQADPAHALLRHRRRHAALSDRAARGLAGDRRQALLRAASAKPPRDVSPGSTTTATATATGSRNTRPARRPATRTWAGRIRATAVVYPDGSLVKGPKALCELQGYVYDAWLRMAEVFDALGKPEPRRRIAGQGGGAVRAVQRGVLGRGTRASTPSPSTARRGRC